MRAWRDRPRLSALLLGLLSAAALPPVHALPVLWLCVPGLLGLIERAPTAREAAWRGLWFGWGHHLAGLYWITSAILVEARDYWWLVPLAVPGLALILAPFIAVACAAAWRAAGRVGKMAALAGAWVLADLARQFIGTGFPWDPWGAVWTVPGSFGDIMIQPAAWIGVHGLTALTLLVAALPWLGRRGAGLAALGLAAWAAAGWTRLHVLPTPPAAGLTVILVQGNVAQSEKWAPGEARGVFARYLRLSREGLARAGGAPAFLIWPESSFPGLLDREPLARAEIADAAAGVADLKGALIGGVRFDEAGRPFNSLFALSPSGEISSIYDKWHLVPFGEYAPTWLPFAVRLVPGGGFARGGGPRTLTMPGAPPFGPLICYEAIFPAQAVDTRQRPAWMVNATNDAWFGDSSGPRQHWEAARLRAVEEGLPLMRAANTGITGGIDAFGRVIGRLPMGHPAVITIALPGPLSPSFFARWGLPVPGTLACLLFLCGLCRSTIRRRRWLDSTRSCV